MHIPFTRLQDQYQECRSEINSSVQNILDTNDFVNGPSIQSFEKLWADHCGTEDCATVANGTFALILSLIACGVKSGHEVITTPHTFISTVEAIKIIGADPIFVDIDEYYHIDVDRIENKITSKTKAILFVDLYGQTPNIDKLREIANRNNLLLIEDAAHSTGAEFKNTRVGSLSDLTCFSFNPIKNLGAIGDAGAVTGKKDLIEKIKIFRDHGRRKHDEYISIGYNARMDSLQAAVLTKKIEYYLNWNTKKRKIAETYNQNLHAITPLTRKDCLHSYYVYVIQVPNRNAFINYMKEQNIETKIHYKTSVNSHQPYFPYQLCPQAEWVCDQIVSIPCYYSMSETEQNYVIEHCNKWIKKFS